jgi:SAM-dependent methyltransferase
MGTSGRPEIREPEVQGRDGKGAAQQPEVQGSDVQGSDVQGSDVQRSVQRARHAASQARQAADVRAQRDRLRETRAREMFARPVRDYAHRNAGRPVRVLRAGFGASLDELGLSQLRDRGYEITVVTVDQASPGAPALAPAPVPAGDIRIGDLRAVPILPRSFDIVHCALLLDRIRHVELVLDRLIAALRPGGFLMLRIRDRDCAIGLLDRRLPRPARRLLRTRLDVGEAPAAGRPGSRPLVPAVYERACSDHGIQVYARMRGLVITQRETVRTWPDGPDRLARTVTATCRLIGRLTHGRLTDAHDEVLYVIRKPEDHFARVV